MFRLRDPHDPGRWSLFVSRHERPLWQPSRRSYLVGTRAQTTRAVHRRDHLLAGVGMAENRARSAAVEARRPKAHQSGPLHNQLLAPPGVPRGHVELTPQEEAVSLLVAQGLSNREVAAELYVSPKTVQYHLTRIYAKLGVRSRAELGAARR